MSKYKIENPNRQFNDWDAVEEQIKILDKKIDDAVLGNTDFEHISGEPEDNVKLKEALDSKANQTDLDSLQDEVTTLESTVDDKVDKETGKSLVSDTDIAQITTNKNDISDIKEDITSIETELDNLDNDKVDKEEGKSLVSNEDITQITTNKEDIAQLQSLVASIPIIQLSTMPEASQDYIGKIVQYIGPSTADFINGYFYQCGYDEELLSYKWMEKKVMNAAEEGGVDAYTKAETNQLLDNKQDKLTAGEGIKITGNVIMQDIINDTLTSPQTTWSSRYLESLFHSLSGLSSIEIVNERPQTPTNNTLYYVKAYEEGEEPLYEIWFFSNNQWTQFGTTAIDLTNYYTKTEVDTLLSGKQDALTPGQGIDITNNNITAKIDGTTLGINDAGNIYVKSGGGGSGGFTPTSAQLTAMNSGIDAEKVAQIATNATNISSIDSDIDTINDTITDLQTDKADKSDTYTKTEVDTALADKQDEIEDSIQASTPTDNDYISDLNGTTNKRWILGNFWDWIKSKVLGIASNTYTSTATDTLFTRAGAYNMYNSYLKVSTPTITKVVSRGSIDIKQMGKLVVVSGWVKFPSTSSQNLWTGLPNPSASDDIKCTAVAGNDKTARLNVSSSGVLRLEATQDVSADFSFNFSYIAS